jgi:two-component system, chemotaxis family, protein-glutamate methylesterase/glutaminase
MPRLRVLVADDSLTVRRQLCEIVAADPDLELVGEAADGKRAIELCTELRPDVVTLDMMMPVMTGLASTEYIMAHCPTPILIVSASVNRGELFRTYDALAAGAVDVLEKPTGHEPAGEWEQRFVATLKLVARIRVITHVRGRLQGRMPVRPPSDLRRPNPSRRTELIVLGASTGGPAALVEVLRNLPPNIGVPVLIVLHIGDPFAAAFADWLDAQTEHTVALARDGEHLASNRVVLAPAGRHLVVEARRTRLVDSPPRHSCCPSVDVLFESVARSVGAGVTACLLTGMGRDGALGMRAIRDAGGCTIAQDEASCVVFGMPREAILIDAAERVLPLAEIGSALATLVGSRKDGEA